MDRKEPSDVLQHDGLPRPRGDGPRALTISPPVSESPPPTRGWTHAGELGKYLAKVSPAHAGMDPSRRSPTRDVQRLPRPRGDGPDILDSHTGIRKSPPPTRGWTPQRLSHVLTVRVSPAHAGMDPRMGLFAPILMRLPRPRGDGPAISPPCDADASSPPPTRGWTLRIHLRQWQRTVSPAHAGMDRFSARSNVKWLRLPRPRGDGPVRPHHEHGGDESPPPTRGWTRPSFAFTSPSSVSPAHAGMDPIAISALATNRRLPRPRGDGPDWRRMARISDGSPPPTRGWTLAPTIEDTPVLVSPRPRGDGPPHRRTAGFCLRSPPPTRGWTRADRGVARIVPVSPAHAGMDRTRRT